MQWLIGIDALRFFAIALIIIYHLFRNILPGGFIAVEIFFTISGFLIFTKLVNQYAQNRKIFYWSFLKTRFLRLFPTLLFCVILTLLLSLAVHPDTIAGTRLNAFAALTFTTNIKELISGGSYENFISPNLFEHTWFLALEMQFYILAPLLVTLVVGSAKQIRYGAKWLLGILVILAVFSAALMAIYGAIFGMQNRAYFALDTHMSAFCIGGALAVFNYLVPRTPRTAKFIPTLGIIVGLTAIVILATKLSYDNPITYTFGLPFTALLTALMLFCIIKLQVNVHIRRRTFLPVRIMEKIGKYSYGLYLFHWPLYILLPNILQSNVEWWTAPLLNITVSFLLAYFSAKHLDVSLIFSRMRQATQLRYAYAVVALVLIIPAIFALMRAPGVSGITEQLNSMESEINQQLEAAPVDYIGVTSALSSTQSAMLHQLDVMANHDASPTPQTVSRAAPNANSAQVLIIGDSVTLGAKQAIESTINSSFVDAAESRGIWTVRNILVNYAASGRLPSIIVISLATNEYAITEDVLQGIVNSADSGHIFVFTTGYAGPLQPRESQNATIRSYADKHTNVYFADWWEIAHNNWSLMYADHIHLNPEGRTAYANLLNNVIRSIRR